MTTSYITRSVHVIAGKMSSLQADKFRRIISPV